MPSKRMASDFMFSMITVPDQGKPADEVNKLLQRLETVAHCRITEKVNAGDTGVHVLNDEVAILARQLANRILGNEKRNAVQEMIGEGLLAYADRHDKYSKPPRPKP